MSVAISARKVIQGAKAPKEISGLRVQPAQRARLDQLDHREISDSKAPEVFQGPREQPGQLAQWVRKV